ncbi:helix-turn-helix domain-containing protein [Cytobacillus kochii]|uniref:helix-turn-helix domain-containing protein n=1 Tax=Cytobacillus kochii TaxID=859143 RepID=UPI001CD2109F|nr:helix-turn-helix domain-containing protein [Cytobacillus kochii]MCA1027673.1 helix-turn-helix domain-containing protein [Cytobacillus kochii]
MKKIQPMLTAKDVAKRLNVSIRFAYELMQRSDLTTVKMGRSVRVEEDDLQKWIDKQKQIS